jgi:hypothetical protein
MTFLHAECVRGCDDAPFNFAGERVASCGDIPAAQTLALAGDQLSISGGNAVTLPSAPGAQMLALAGDQLSISGGNAVTIPVHSTESATCPNTGPTVAPTTEGHYFYTSPLGEKWQWIFGDAAPFVVGNRTGDTIAGTAGNGGVGALPLLGANAVTMPRDGFVSVSAWDAGGFTALGANAIVRTGIQKNGTEVAVSRDNGQTVLGAQRQGNVSIARLAVAAGDVLSMNMSAGTGSGSVVASQLVYQYV